MNQNVSQRARALLVRCSIEKFVYILKETIPRLCVSHKCVKGCGDDRDINFVRMGLRFASERFFDGSHTHTQIHTHTHTHTRSLHELTNPASGVTNLAPHVTNPSSDVTIHYTKVMNLSSTVQILPLK